MRIHLLAFSMASSQQGCKHLGISPFTIRVAAFWNFLATDHIISRTASTSIKLSVFQCFPAPTLSPGIGWILQVTRSAQLAACHWSLLDKQYIILRAKCAPASAAGSRCPLLGRSKHCCSAHKTENWVSKVQTLTTFTCHMRCNPEMSVSFSFFLSFLRQTRSGFRNNCNFKLRLHFADCTRQKVHYNSFSANLKLPDYK